MQFFRRCYENIRQTIYLPNSKTIQVFCAEYKILILNALLKVTDVFVTISVISVSCFLAEFKAHSYSVLMSLHNRESTFSYVKRIWATTCCKVEGLRV